MRSLILGLLMVACAPSHPNDEWCNAADDWMRVALARDHVNPNFAKAPPCIVKETGDDDFRIVGHG